MQALPTMDTLRWRHAWYGRLSHIDRAGVPDVALCGYVPARGWFTTRSRAKPSKVCTACDDQALVLVDGDAARFEGSG